MSDDNRVRPDINCVDAQSLLERLYGVKVTSVKELDSYDDRNYYVHISDHHSNPNITEIWRHGYVFKILNSWDSKEKHVEAEHQAMHILDRAGIVCPLPIPNLHGEEYSLEEITPSGETVAPGTHVVRLLTYLPGKILLDVPYTPHLLRSVGDTLGRITTAMKGWKHGAIQNLDRLWSLAKLPSIRKLMYVIRDKHRTELLDEIITAFEMEVLPHQGQFQSGAIHADFNDQNILVTPIIGEHGRADHRVSGVIDFGDMLDSCYVYDVAIAIMYMMISSREVSPLIAGGHVLAGYLPHVALKDEEWAVLKICVAGRFCQSLVIGVYAHSKDSDNEYLLATAKEGWQMLELLWRTPNEILYKGWQRVIQEANKTSF